LPSLVRRHFPSRSPPPPKALSPPLFVVFSPVTCGPCPNPYPARPFFPRLAALLLPSEHPTFQLAVSSPSNVLGVFEKRCRAFMTAHNDAVPRPLHPFSEVHHPGSPLSLFVEEISRLFPPAPCAPPCGFAFLFFSSSVRIFAGSLAQRFPPKFQGATLYAGGENNNEPLFPLTFSDGTPPHFPFSRSSTEADHFSPPSEFFLGRPF